MRCRRSAISAVCASPPAAASSRRWRPPPTPERAGRSPNCRTALRTGYVRGDTPWDALARLGNDADLPDLAELAAALSLAGDQGAAVRDTVSSKAKAIRERLTADAERSAAQHHRAHGHPGHVAACSASSSSSATPPSPSSSSRCRPRATAPHTRSKPWNTIIRLTAWLQACLAEARSTGREKADRGEVVEKVIIVAAAAAIAIAAMAAIATAVDIKIGGLQL